MFSNLSKTKIIVLVPFILSSANALKLDQSKIVLFGNRLTLPNAKILDMSKLKAFAGDKIDVTEKLKFVLERVENIVGKGENAGYQHFLLFPQCFPKASFSGSLKEGIVR